MARYITPEGYDRLRAERDRLWHEERPRVTHEVAEAAALGDRSENAEYQYGKKRLREIDRRLRFLARRLDELTVVRTAPPRQDRIYFGAHVRIEDGAGRERTLRLVGPDESEASAGRISVDSPLGRALIGREEGDVVELERPRGRTEVTVLAIRYAPFAFEEAGGSEDASAGGQGGEGDAGAASSIQWPSGSRT